MLNSTSVKYWELIHSPESLGKHRDNTYNARCDVCGDSQKNKNKKRLYLYTKDSYKGDSVKCQNCGYSKPFYTYLKNYHPDLAPGYRSEMGFTTISNLKSDAVVIKEVKKTNTLYTFEKPPEFKHPNKQIAEYLKSRGFDKEILQYHLFRGVQFYLSEGNVKLGDKNVNLKNFIIIPLLENNKWYGFYSRSLVSKTFYTYLPEQNTGYRIWNWFNVNKKDKVYIFEAIFNAMSTTFQSIACLGSDINDAQLKQLSHPIFVFDNDRTGVEKALKYANKGYSVFVWPDEIKTKDISDVNDLLREGWCVEDIDNLITNNIFSGVLAITKLTLKIT